MSFKNKILQNGAFAVTSEIGPPKGTDIGPALEDAKLLKGLVDAINVTDLQSSVMRLGSLVTCHLLVDLGIEPIFQMTCRDRNRLALESDLLSAHVLGIRNVLALTGDHTTLGDHPEAKPVFDLDSVTLLETIQKLNSGADMSGKKLAGNTDFFAGAVVNPGADPLEPEIIKMEKKIRAGAKFFQTQAVYDMALYKRFKDNIRHLNIPVMAGIVLLKSAGMARFMNKNVAGVRVPDAVINEMDKAPDKPKISVEIASRLISELKDLSDGVHIMPLGWDRLVPEILERTGLKI